MIGTAARLLVSLTIPVRESLGSAGAVASLRCAVGWRSMSAPPRCAVGSRDCGGLVGSRQDSGPPLPGVLEVEPVEVVGRELLPGRPRVREAALRQDPLVDAGVRVRHLLLDERSARAAGADRVPELAVLLDQ